MNETNEVKDYGPRTNGIITKFELTEDQADQLDSGLHPESDEQRISSYSNLHGFISRNAGYQLTKLADASFMIDDSHLKEFGFTEGEGLDDLRVVELKEPVELPGGLTLQPGRFVWDTHSHYLIRGDLEIRNAAGKGIGLSCSRCSGNDYPEYYTRDAGADAAKQKVDWDRDNGPRMNTISDMWVRPQNGRDLSNTEAIVIGLMQANNKSKAEKEHQQAQSVDDAITEVRDSLTL